MYLIKGMCGVWEKKIYRSSNLGQDKTFSVSEIGVVCVIQTEI